MPNVTFVEVLAPFRSEQRIPALRAGDDWARPTQGGCIPGSDLHDASCLFVFPPRRPVVTRLGDRIVTVIGQNMKQRR